MSISKGITSVRSYIYVLHDEAQNSCKIGKTNNVEIRRGKLQTGNVSPLKVVFVVEVDEMRWSKIERRSRQIGANYYNKVVIGDWLKDTSVEIAIECVEMAILDIERPFSAELSRFRIRRHIELWIESGCPDDDLM